MSANFESNNFGVDSDYWKFKMYCRYIRIEKEQRDEAKRNTLEAIAKAKAQRKHFKKLVRSGEITYN
jgi:hypothetical protein